MRPRSTLTPHSLRLFACVVACCAALVACSEPKPEVAYAPPEPDIVAEWDVAVSHPLLLAATPGEQMVRIDVGAMLPKDTPRRTVNLSLVIDHSGSMNGAQMADAQRAVLALLDQLQPEDRVSVIAFASQVDILQAQKPWQEVDQPALRAAIAELSPQGTTAMTEALGAALQEVGFGFSNDAVNRVLLLSDGEANDPTYLPSFADSARQQGIAITTMGLGPYYNEEMLALLADRSGGRYRFIERSDDLADFFLAEIESLQQVAMNDANLVLTLGPRVSFVQGFGGDFYVSGKQVSVYLGQFAAGDRRQLGLKLAVDAPAAGAHVEILDARLTWTDAATGVSGLQLAEYLGASASQDAAAVEHAMDGSVVEAVGRLQAALQIEQALVKIAAGAVAAGEAELRAGAEQYRENNMLYPVAAPAGIALDEAALDLADVVGGLGGVDGDGGGLSTGSGATLSEHQSLRLKALGTHTRSTYTSM